MGLITQQLINKSDFGCTLTELFSDCPTLTDVATTLLVEQWQARRLGTQSPAQLMLRSSMPKASQDFIRPLHQLLIERYCNRASIHLDSAQDELIETANDIKTVAVDLSALERLINDCGPVLIDHYKQALVDYWNRADSHGITPWQRYSGYLRQQLLTSIGHARRSLSPQAIEMAVALAAYPCAESRQLAHSRALRLSVLSVRLSPGLRLGELASALVIEPDSHSEGRQSALLYSLSGRLLEFESMQALLDSLGRHWPELTIKHPQLYLRSVPGHALDAQASHMFEQQLHCIDTVAEQCDQRDAVQRLNLSLTYLTSMLDLCPDQEQLGLEELAKQFPDWLRNASEASRDQYAGLLVDIGQAYDSAKGGFWLDGVDDAELFAYTRLSERLLRDHPDNTLQPWNLQVINHQTVAAALPNGNFDGSVTPVTYTLAQLAIGNLGLLQAGRVELKDKSGQALPSWMNEAYLRTLITELDIGKAYPDMLQRSLLDDDREKSRRKHLLSQQLRAQLPAAALELHLQQNKLTLDGVRVVRRLFAPLPTQTAVPLIQPLGFLSEPDVPVDLARNAWLIEPDPSDGATLCLLYRPLHAQPLLEFSGRKALLAALAATGDLQTDILDRLPESVQSIYANGGFLEPNLPHLRLTSFILPYAYQRPGPVTLARTAAADELAEAIYQGCVAETIEHFKRHASTSAQTQRQQWQQLGWLLLNLVLPLTGGIVAATVWVVQVGAALRQYLQTDAKRTPSQHRIALVNLLVNVALAIFASTRPSLRLKSSPDPALSEPAPNALAPVAVTAQAADQAVHQPLAMDWAHTDAILDKPQRESLARLRAGRNREALGEPIESGHWAGLYQTDDEHWVVLGRDVYRVSLDEDLQQPRIIGATDEQALGPWLHRNSSGHWQPDLRLRLRGGMPRSTSGRARLQQSRLALETLRATLDRDLATGRDYIMRLNVLQDLLKADEREPSLRRNLASIDTIAQFWDKHVADIKRYIDLQPGARLQSRLSLTLFQQFASKVVRHSALSTLIDLKMVESALQHLEHPHDLATALERLEETPELTNQLVSNGDRLRDTLTELERLASRYHEGTEKWLATARECLKVPIDQVTLSSRLRRIDSAWRRLLMQPELSDRAYYLLRRGWKNLDLAISQRLRLFAMPQASEELSARLLHDMHNKLSVVQSALDRFKAEILDKPVAQAILAQLQEDVRFAANHVKSELEDYPPVSTVEQLRQKTPGLIETTSHGLLLGQPRASDASLVDILDEHQRPLMTFHNEQGEWVQSKEPEPETGTAPVTPVPAQRLGQLFGKAEEMMSGAQQMLSFMQSKAAENFLPVEIEELLELKREPVARLESTLRQRLAGEPGLAPADLSSYTQRLDTLAEQLSALLRRSEEICTKAIVRHKPQMSGLRYLIDRQQVRIQLVKRRKELSAVQGRPQDYLDEYEILRDGRPLWYAHFHYRSRLDENPDYVAGHLKTAAQRSIRGQTLTDPNTQKVEFVYRAPITRAEAVRYFFAPQADASNL
jgi:hypothetical protein